MIDECVIFQPRGLGVRQISWPVCPLIAMSNASLPPGARITEPLTINGHWPAYHCGTVAPYWRTKSRPHRNSPVVESRQATWHFGPMVTTIWSVTAGTVRDMPWLRLIETG